MTFNFNSILLVAISTFSILTLYTDKSEWVRILISSIGVIMGLIPIIIDFSVLLKQKSSRAILIKREIFKFIYSDLFEEMNAKWSHLGKGFFCNQAMVEPEVLRGINVYTPNNSEVWMEEYSGFNFTFNHIHICDYNCVHVTKLNKFKNVVNSLIFLSRLKNDIEMKFKENIGSKVIGLKDNIFQVNGNRPLINVLGLSMNGVVDLNENFCYINYFKRYLKVVLLHKKTLVKTKIIDDECSFDKMCCFVKMIIRHSKNLNTGYCIDTGLVRRGVRVLHSVSYQDYFYNKFNTNFNKIKLDFDFIVEGIEDESKNIKNCEINRFFVVEYYIEPFTKKFGETLAKTLISHNKDFWGEYNFNALDYIYKRQSARLYRLIGPNYKSKRYLVDVSLMFEKAGIPRFTHLDMKVRNTRMGIEYCNCLAKDIARKEGKKIETVSIDCDIKKLADDENILRTLNKSKSPPISIPFTHEQQVNKKVMEFDGNKDSCQSDDKKTVETLQRFNNLYHKIKEKIDRLNSEINDKRGNNPNYIEIKRINNKKLKLEKEMVEISKINNKNLFAYLKSYRETRSLLKNRNTERGVKESIVSFEKMFKIDQKEKMVAKGFRDHNRIILAYEGKKDRTDDLLKKVELERPKSFCQVVKKHPPNTLNETNEIIKIYSDNKKRENILEEIDNKASGGLDKFLKKTILEQEVKKWSLVDDFRNLKTKYKPPIYKPECEILVDNYYKVLCKIDVEKGVELIKNVKKPQLVNNSKKINNEIIDGEAKKKAKKKFVLNETTASNLKDVNFTPRKKRKIIERFIKGEKCGLKPSYNIKFFDVGSFEFLKDKIYNDLEPYRLKVNIGKVFKKVTIEDKLQTFKEKYGIGKYKRQLKIVNKYLEQNKKNFSAHKKVIGFKRQRGDIQEDLEKERKYLKLSCRGVKLNLAQFKHLNKKEKGKEIEQIKKLEKIKKKKKEEMESDKEMERKLDRLMAASGCRRMVIE